MGAVLADVATAVTVELNLNAFANFGVTFEAVRSYGEWNTQLEDIDDSLHVDVVPARYDDATLAERGGNIRHLVAVHIAVRKRFRVSASTERFTLSDIDDKLKLLEDINDFFVQKRLSSLPYTAMWVASSIPTPYTPAHLAFGQYTGVAEVIYEIVGT